SAPVLGAASKKLLRMTNGTPPPTRSRIPTTWYIPRRPDGIVGESLIAIRCESSRNTGNMKTLGISHASVLIKGSKEGSRASAVVKASGGTTNTAIEVHMPYLARAQSSVPYSAPSVNSAGKEFSGCEIDRTLKRSRTEKKERMVPAAAAPR